jgi:hypothetical protein
MIATTQCCWAENVWETSYTVFISSHTLWRTSYTVFISSHTLWETSYTVFISSHTLWQTSYTVFISSHTLWQLHTQCCWFAADFASPPCRIDIRRRSQSGKSTRREAQFGRLYISFCRLRKFFSTQNRCSEGPLKESLLSLLTSCIGSVY